jgi:hypothetical protein
MSEILTCANAQRLSDESSRHERQAGCHALSQHSPINKKIMCVFSALRAQLAMEANLLWNFSNLRACHELSPKQVRYIDT